MVNWRYIKGILTIRGSGKMNNFSSCRPTPWCEQDIHKVVIKNGVTSIGSYAFYGCDKMNSVYIPDSVTSIGDCAFSHCKNLLSISIPDSVTEISGGAFESCESLVSVAIPGKVKAIGYGVFYGCKRLTFVTITENTDNIGYAAFSGCESLSSLIICDFTGGGYIAPPFDRETPFTSRIAMIKSCDYDVKMKADVKYDLLRQLFKQKPDEKELTAFIKKNFSRMMRFAIDRDDVETVRAGRAFLNGRNIDTLVNYAIDKTQNDDSPEIQAVLMNYKNKHFGDKKKTLRL